MDEAQRVRISRPTPSRLVERPVEAPPAREPAGNGQPARTAISGPVSLPAVPPPPSRRSGSTGPPTDLVFVIRDNGDLVFSNTPLGGLTEEDLIGTSLFDWVMPDQRSEVAERVRVAFTTSQVQQQELAGILQHDPDAWYECRITPNYREGRVVSATVVAHEITRHKELERGLAAEVAELTRLLDERTEDLEQARAALAEGPDTDQAASRFRRILDDAGEAIFITDRESGELIDVNETGCRWLRRSRKSLIGARSADLELGYPILVPEALELELTETRDTRRPHLLDRGAHRRSDGSTFPVEVAVATHVVGGREYVLAVARDIKNRKRLEDRLRETEAQYRLLFEQSWDAIYVTARAGEIVDVNGAALELFGYTRDDFMGMNARDLFARPEDIRAFQREMSRAGTVAGLDVVLKTKDGATMDGVLSATRRRDEVGGIRGYQCILRALSAPVARESQVVAVAQTNGRVLVVEPSADLREELSDTLSEAGLNVLQASDAYDGLELFRASAAQVGVVVVNATGAAKESRRALEVMRSLSDDARFVLVGDEDPVTQAERFGDLGVAVYLKTPVHPLALIQKVRELAGIAQT